MTALEFPEHEEVLHWVWAEQHFRTEDLRISDGAALVVEFPGWANRGAAERSGGRTGLRVKHGHS